MIDVKNHVFDTDCNLSDFFFYPTYFIYSSVSYQIEQYLLQTKVYLHFEGNTFQKKTMNYSLYCMIIGISKLIIGISKLIIGISKLIIDIRL